MRIKQLLDCSPTTEALSYIRQAGLHPHHGAAPKSRLARVSLLKPAVEGVYERLTGGCYSCDCRVQLVPCLPQVIKHPAAQARRCTGSLKGA